MCVYHIRKQTNVVLCYLTCRQVIAVLTQLERGGYMFSARLEFDCSMANPLGKWGASHTPEIHSGISQLHNPQPINNHR